MIAFCFLGGPGSVSDNDLLFLSVCFPSLSRTAWRIMGSAGVLRIVLMGMVFVFFSGEVYDMTYIHGVFDPGNLQFVETLACFYGPPVMWFLFSVLLASGMMVTAFLF